MRPRRQAVERLGQLIIGKVATSNCQVGHYPAVLPPEGFNVLRIELAQAVAFALREQLFELGPVRLASGDKVTEGWHRRITRF